MTRHRNEGGTERVAAYGRPPAVSLFTHNRQPRKLVRDASEAAQLRAHQTHPNVTAWRVDQVRRQADRRCWANRRQHSPAAARGHEGSGGARKLFADYLAEPRQAWTPDVAITPGWVRETTGCSRGLSPRHADALAAEVDTNDATRGVRP